jgi:hypothetical protein
MCVYAGDEHILTEQSRFAFKEYIGFYIRQLLPTHFPSRSEKCAFLRERRFCILPSVSDLSLWARDKAEYIKVVSVRDRMLGTIAARSSTDQRHRGQTARAVECPPAGGPHRNVCCAARFLLESLTPNFLCSPKLARAQIDLGF